MNRFRAAWRAVAWHAGLSALVGGLAAILVFVVWFPFPYATLSGGTDLFLLVVVVDMVCGPLLTAVIYTPSKPKRELFQDLAFVAVIQLSALVYGLYTVSVTRPVYLVFEVDRFRVVSTVDIQSEKLKPELGGLHALSWTGPRIIGSRRPLNSDEMLQSLDLSMQGFEPSARPDWWQPYELSKQDVLRVAKPIQVLRDKQPASSAIIDTAVFKSGRDERNLRWLPLTSFKTTSWVVFLDGESAAVLGFAPTDGF